MKGVAWKLLSSIPICVAYVCEKLTSFVFYFNESDSLGTKIIHLLFPIAIVVSLVISCLPISYGDWFFKLGVSYTPLLSFPFANCIQQVYWRGTFQVPSNKSWFAHWKLTFINWNILTSTFLLSFTVFAIVLFRSLAVLSRQVAWSRLNCLKNKYQISDSVSEK